MTRSNWEKTYAALLDRRKELKQQIANLETELENVEEKIDIMWDNGWDE